MKRGRGGAGCSLREVWGFSLHGRLVSWIGKDEERMRRAADGLEIVFGLYFYGV